MNDKGGIEVSEGMLNPIINFLYTLPQGKCVTAMISNHANQTSCRCEDNSLSQRYCSLDLETNSTSNQGAN